MPFLVNAVFAINLPIMMAKTVTTPTRHTFMHVGVVLIDFPVIIV